MFDGLVLICVTAAYHRDPRSLASGEGVVAGLENEVASSGKDVRPLPQLPLA